ncbi:serine/threonine-protein kinase [Dictyobacter alpinus]|uniref:serine/threonine-protein kinase n=1 Tax=Dictyobacter alpinus TaxID=2014873 RepID=UPI0013875B07|nr:serine/threonine-protein kinase [Dictyobacter alpinus]
MAIAIAIWGLIMNGLQGHQLGSYVLTRLLGQGGFADVYLGEHMYLHTHAALKVVRMQLSDEHNKRFLTEARIIAHLDHPNIVKVHDFGVHEGTPFLVMAYAPNGSVRSIYTPGKPLPVAQIITYSMSVAEALQHAHAHGVIHRDVKPENMLLGTRDELLLSDFGIAVFTHGDQRHPRDIAGTVAYMAPEQLQGYPCPASDQYALAIVIYEWLSGSLPFTGSRTGIAVQQVMAAPPSLHKRCPEITARVEKIIFKALAKDPRERFSSVLDFVSALKEALEAQYIEKSIYSAASIETVAIGRTRQRPLVGREQEYSLLHQTLLAAERYTRTPEVATDYASGLSWVTPARSPLLVLSGDVGIGKTRLAEEVSRDAYQRGWFILWSRAYAQEGAPYQLWTDILRQAMKQHLWFDVKKESLPTIYQPLMDLLPELALLPLQRTEVSTSTYSDMAPLKLWDAVLAVLTDISKQGPVLIVLDDLQWADQSSCEMISYLSRHMVEYPVVFLATCRETSFSSFYPFRTQVMQLQRELLVNVHHLAALTDNQIACLVEPVKEPALVQRIQYLAAGNPFFAEELARMVHAQERDAAQASDDRIPLTKTITELFKQRLERLTAPCLQLLRAGAILGGSFSFAAMHEMLHTADQPLDEEELLTLLEEALHSGLLTEQGSGHKVTFHFWHPLFTHHIYESMFAARRSLLHKRASQTLLREYARREEEGAALIVHHLQQGGGEPALIVRYAQMAGNRAYALFAYAEAERYYRLAIHQLDLCMNDSFKASQADQQHMVELQEYLAECLRIQGRFRESCDIYTHILELHQQQSLPLSPSEQELDVEIQALLLGRIGRANYDQGNVKQALLFYERGELLLHASGMHSGAALAHLYFQHSYAHWLSGAYEQAQFYALQSCEFLKDVLEQQKTICELKNYSQISPLHRILYGHEIDLADVYGLLGTIAGAIGQYVEGLEHMRTAFDIFQQHDCKRKMAIVDCNMGDVYLKRAEYAQAMQVFRRALIEAQNIQEIPLSTFISCNLGLVAARCGNLSDAEIEIKQAMKSLGRFDDVLAKVWIYTYLALVLADQGKLSEAQKMLCISLKLARLLRIPPYIGPTLITLGYIRLMQARMLDYGTTGTTLLEKERRRLLRRARHTLEYVVKMHGIEAETRCEAQVAMLEVLLLSGEHEQTASRAVAIQQEIARLGIVWLTPRLTRIIGCSLGFQGQYEQAHERLLYSIEQARYYEMSLEYARSLQSYAGILLRPEPRTPENYTLAVQYLHEARNIFRNEKAQLDLQRVNHLLAHASKSGLR